MTTRICWLWDSQSKDDSPGWPSLTDSEVKRNVVPSSADMVEQREVL
jgi:hypothetical protein